MSKICQISPTDRFIKLLTSFMDDLLALCCSSNNNFVHVEYRNLAWNFVACKLTYLVFVFLFPGNGN